MFARTLACRPSKYVNLEANTSVKSLLAANYLQSGKKDKVDSLIRGCPADAIQRLKFPPRSLNTDAYLDELIICTKD